jgi:hypothetical protein
MSLHSVHVSAHLSARFFTPGERISWKLTVVATGGRIIVPDPLSGSDALTLELRGPTGKTEVVCLGDIAPPGGVIETPDGRLLPPGGKVVFEDDLATYFPHIGFGPHWLRMEYKVDGQVWRSPEMPFDFVPGHATFLDATPNQADGFWCTLLWVEHGPLGARAMLFEDDKGIRSVEGATELAAVPDGAEPALGSRPLNKQHIERWVAWLLGSPPDCSLHLEFYAEGDPENPGNTLRPPPAKLPTGLYQPRLVHPLLDEWVDDGRPRSTIAILASDAAGAEALHLFEADAKGRVAPRSVIPIPGGAAGCWAISPSEEARVLAWASAGGGHVSVSGVEIPWHLPPAGHRGLTHAQGVGLGPPPPPRRWLALEADAFLAGDLRCSPEGLVWAGMVVRRGPSWERLVLVAPVGPRARAGADAEIVYRRSFTPPEGAEPVRARIDGSGELHLLYRRGHELAYVPPREQKATFTRDRLGAHGHATAHMLLGWEGRRVIVAYDPDRGPVFEVL